MKENKAEIKGCKATIASGIFVDFLRGMVQDFSRNPIEAILQTTKKFYKTTKAFEKLLNATPFSDVHILYVLYGTALGKLGTVFEEILKVVASNILGRVEHRITSEVKITHLFTWNVFETLSLCSNVAAKAEIFSERLRTGITKYSGHETRVFTVEEYETLEKFSNNVRNYASIVDNHFAAWEKQVIINVKNLLALCD